MGLAQDSIPLERVQPIIEREIAKRDEPGVGGGLERLADEIGASGRMSKDAAVRRLYSIRTGTEYWQPRPSKNPKAPAPQSHIDMLVEAGLWKPTKRRAWLTNEQAYPLLKKLSGPRPKKFVTFNMVDTFLTALDLEWLWHTELEDVYFGGLTEAA